MSAWKYGQQMMQSHESMHGQLPLVGIGHNYVMPGMEIRANFNLEQYDKIGTSIFLRLWFQLHES